MKRRGFLGTVCAGLGVSAGCLRRETGRFEDLEPIGEYWSQFRGRSNGSRHLNTSPPTAQLSQTWDSSIDERTAGPVVYGDTAIIADGRSNGRVVAYDLTDGTKRWTFDLSASETELVGRVLAANQVVLVVAYAFGGPVATGSTISGVDMSDGTRRWARQGEPITYVRVDEAGGAYTVSRDDHVTVSCLDPRSGDTVWERNSGGIVPAGWRDQRWSDAEFRDFVVGERRACLVGRTDGAVVQMFDKRTGEVEEMLSLPVNHVLRCDIVDDSLVVASDSHPEGNITKSVMCWSIPDDELRWVVESERGIGQLVTTHEYVVFLSSPRGGGIELTCVRRATGDVVWKKALDSVPTLAGAGSALYAGDESTLTVYDLETGELRSRSEHGASDALVPHTDGIVTANASKSVSFLS